MDTDRSILTAIREHVLQRMTLLRTVTPLDEKARTMLFARTDELEQLIAVIVGTV